MSGAWVFFGADSGDGYEVGVVLRADQLGDDFQRVLSVKQLAVAMMLVHFLNGGTNPEMAINLDKVLNLDSAWNGELYKHNPVGGK